ncbi:MAG: TonB-dependent receptor [Bacteroidales bacterium]|nr:TonB-dependent receptor [Bacteroidales bacterium]MCM1147111.1 TonB-dependent receptor [Bacteroidales bacterium]MCM1205755.1 TonB-dependent receptor [Bacillota bacterium]MCM1511146.1 TonB-dependent receptor [Clostridium sp.]
MRIELFFIFLLASVSHAMAAGKVHTVSGTVLDGRTLKPLAYSTLKIRNMELWAVADDNGRFSIANVPEGLQTLEVTMLGYVSMTVSFRLLEDTVLKSIRMKEDNLSLPGVEVTAKKRTAANTTAYTMDRTMLDHSQILNLSDITALLPGGQTVNTTLMDDSRIALRAGTGERGNAAFGTAIEVDGMRLDNNADMDETMSASTRSLASSNIESVEVISGIPGVEYGDVSNGVVKVNTRSGRSPWILEASVNPYTRQVAFNKGFALPGNGGVLNVSFEHARSYSDIASPYTSYDRNTLTASYAKAFTLGRSSLNLRSGVTAGIGGYDSEADPDAFKDTYRKIRDNLLRANIDINWLYNSGGRNVFNVLLHAGFSIADKRAENYTNSSSASSQAYLHTMTSGYAIAGDYSTPEAAYGNIILGPAGYWYVRSFNDQKPLSLRLKLKGEWTKHLGAEDSGLQAVNKLTLGAELNSSRNNGRGLYYEDMSLAPTWRPYDYSTLPAMRNLALFLEDRLTLGRIVLTAGLRNDLTMLRGSDYGTVGSLSPRVSARYDLIKDSGRTLTLHAGYGKSVKLPSFQVLYPADTYSDKLVFTPGSTADNKAYYAYYTYVSKPMYNSDLKWQYTNQIDFGADAEIKGAKLSLSFFRHVTHNPYQMVNVYSPFSYNYTSQAALENCGIDSPERMYSVDNATGVVTVTSVADGRTVTLPYSVRNTFNTNRRYVNGSPVTRYGLEWIAEMPLLGNSRPVGLSLRLDGSYYHYKGVDNTLIAGCPNGIGDYAADSGTMPLIGYYAGSNVTSAASASTPSVSNGTLSKGCSLNTTLTARIPRLRMIMTLRLEATFLNYRRNLSEGRNAVILKAAGDVSGTPYGGEKDCYVALYPEYYSTWQNPSERIPFAQALEGAAENDPVLYRQLCNLIVRSNTSYYLNPQDISSYYSANFSVTKEIGRNVSLSFYANNFFNNMSMVRNSQTGLETSLFNSGYIPKFYYGLSVRIKIN